MIPNLIILFAGLFILYGVAMLWLRQNLMNDLEALHQNELILKKDLERRRDLVPFLLEGAREGRELSDSWLLIARKRAAFTQPQPFAAEVEFERFLQDYLAQNTAKTVMYLEAKKDIQEMSDLVEAQKEKLKTLAQDFNDKRKQFPYSLTSAIFAIRDVRVLA